MKDLVIVESPTKAKTIDKYLGGGYQVVSSKGHVLDLPEKDLGVNIEDGFEPTFVVQNEKLVDDLQRKVKDTTQVLLATDNDREGEAIAYDLRQILNGKQNGDGEKFQRIIFNEITKETIREAITQPLSIDLNKVDAQRARRILDRLVGYLISPLLSKSISGSRFEGLSAGRVQSVALRFIVDREEEREAFEPEEYWEIAVTLGKGEKGKGFELELKRIDDEKPDLGSREETEAVVEDLNQAEYTVADLKEKTKQRSPLPPFITSSLQRAASSVLHFSPSKTMRIAQQLYEGIELEEGIEGLITYMRTDSTRVAGKAREELRNYVEQTFGENYVVDNPRYFRKSDEAQDAHEAIRPTQVSRSPEAIRQFLKNDQYKLYKLIWDRFVATQMSNARYLRRKLEVEGDGYLFKTSASERLFDGFLKVLELKPLSDEDVDLPDNLSEGDGLDLLQVDPSQHFTNPPNRFSEAGLINDLEKGGIGRPSTYASIIHTIQSRNYVRKDNGSFVPTLLGFIAVNFLKQFFPETVQPELTAQMEESLDQIKNGDKTKEEVLAKFYEPLKGEIEEVEGILDSKKNVFEVRTDVACPKCLAPMNIRYWQGSPYLSCSDWPDCEETRNLPDDISFTFKEGQVLVAEELQKREKEAEELEGGKCEVCGSAMEVKHGRYGRFLSCTNEDCDNTKSIPTGVKCPSCGEGELVERYSRKRKQKFYGCSNYPDCKFTTSRRPHKQCPDCKSGVLIKDSSGDKLVCTTKSCNHQEELDSEEKP
ncbi:MAG: type I DNA topoisomerase [Candidatus Bipolaricaulota bacterium]